MVRSTTGLAILATIVTLGCGTQLNGEPIIGHVDPSEATTLVSTRATVHGQNFFQSVTLDLDDTSPAEPIGQWRVRLNDVEIVDVQWVGLDQIDFVVPGGLAAGAYDVTVISPTGLTSRLANALRVTDDPIGLEVSIEDAPGGLGTVVTDRVLAAGESLVLYAVLRDGDEFVHDLHVRWSVDVVIGTLPDALTSTALFEAQTVGTGTVTAAHAVARDAQTGMLEVLSGAPAIVRVEDNPGGSGSPLAAQTRTTDEPVPLFAVSRDAFGNFVADEPATWMVNGSIGAIAAGPSESATFDPTMPGLGSIQISHQDLATIGTADITVVPGRVSSFAVMPSSTQTYVSGPSIPFAITDPVDADANPTTDLGTITWTVESGSFADLNSEGLLTPASAGTGIVRATSSYGPFNDANVVVYTSSFVVTSVAAPTIVYRGQQIATIQVAVLNLTAADAKLLATRFTFSRMGAGVDADYVVAADYRNATLIAAGATEILSYQVSVAAGATLGNIDIVTDVLAYLTDTGLFASDTHTAAWDVQSTSLPVATITAPVSPADKICAGQSVSFSGSTSTDAIMWNWSFSGGTPTTSTASDPTGITYAVPGTFPYHLTVTGSSGAADTAWGARPVYVGSATSPPHIAGAIVFETPTSGESVNISGLPKIDMAGAGDPTNVTDCAGTPLLETDPTAYVTLFVDRGEIDPARDQDALKPGVQVELHQGNHFDDVVWRSVTPMVEGSAIVYAEFRKEPEGVVTASGWIPVALVSDKTMPTVDATLPTSDCVAACFGKGETWAFRFDEPMDEVALLANTLVEFTSSTTCDGGTPTDITATSTLTYDVLAKTLYVTPASQPASNYSVTVRINKEATDTASAPNELDGGDVSLCAVLADRAPPPTASAPTLVSIDADPVSPDGDSVDDTTTFNVSVDSATILVQLEIDTGGAAIYRSSSPVAGGGAFGLMWNGRDHSGRALPNGYYVYTLTALNALGVASTSTTGVIEVRSGVSMVGVPRWLN